MKCFLLFCAFVFSSIAVQAGDTASRLIQPKGSSLRLVELQNTQELHVEFTGNAWVAGTLHGEWATGGRANNTILEYRLVPDAESMGSLPYFLINDPPYRNSYKVKSIEIANGADALRWAIGSAAAQRFLAQKAGRVHVTARFELESFSVGVECDAAWAKAKVSRVQLPGKAVRHQRIPEGC